jgi:hypothetical protein
VDRDPLTGIPASRHPFQFWMLTAAVFAGTSALLTEAAPATLESLIPQWTVYIWSGLLIIGGALGLPAGFWKDRLTGLLLERIALAALAAACFVYAIVLVAVAGKPGTVSAAFQMTVSIAAIWRIVHVNRELRLLTLWINNKGVRPIKRPFHESLVDPEEE